MYEKHQILMYDEIFIAISNLVRQQQEVVITIIFYDCVGFESAET
jgi:hypothetical protein